MNAERVGQLLEGLLDKIRVEAAAGARCCRGGTYGQEAESIRFGDLQLTLTEIQYMYLAISLSPPEEPNQSVRIRF